LHHRPFLKHLSRYKTAFFTFGFLFIINILQSQQPILAIYSIIKILEIYFVFFLFRYRKTPILDLVLPLLAGGFLEAFLALYQFTQFHSVQGVFYYFGERLMSISTPGIAKAEFLNRQILRPYGTFSHPNSMGGFYLLVYSLCLFLSTRKEDFKKKLPILLLLGISTLLLVLSFSKIVILAYVGITLLFFIDQYHKKNSDQSCLICVVSKLLIPCILAVIFLQTQSDPATLEKRLMFLQQGIMILFQTFFLGTGLGQYLYYQSSYPSPYPYFFLQPVHNIFMLYFIQTGIITTIFTSYCGLWFIRRYYKSIWYIFLVILATGLFDHYWLTLQQNMLVMGVIFGYATHLIDRRVIEQKIS
jgi:hypothetical protein